MYHVISIIIPNITLSNDNNIMYWNAFCEENEIITNKLIKRYSYQNYTKFSLPFPLYNTD